MAEIAVPMVGLGLLYIANKQNNDVKGHNTSNLVLIKKTFEHWVINKDFKHMKIKIMQIMKSMLVV